MTEVQRQGHAWSLHGRKGSGTLPPSIAALQPSRSVPRTVTKGLPWSGYREGPGFAGLLFSVFLRQASQHVTQAGLELMEILLPLPPEGQVFAGSHITEHARIQETGAGV